MHVRSCHAAWCVHVQSSHTAWCVYVWSSHTEWCVYVQSSHTAWCVHVQSSGIAWCVLIQSTHTASGIAPGFSPSPDTWYLVLLSQLGHTGSCHLACYSAENRSGQFTAFAKDLAVESARCRPLCVGRRTPVHVLCKKVQVLVNE